MSNSIFFYIHCRSKVAMFEELALDIYLALAPFQALTTEERSFMFEQLGILAKEVVRVERPLPNEACAQVVKDIRKAFEACVDHVHHGHFDYVRMLMGNFVAVVKRTGQ
ncbi:hypothetical protein HDK77DRAFT_486606 [Phyllosticta capitalensis]|uniref:Uncharacterized protein n=1 Tax=Phyllosticta capitalensis TaxID=121624 RepID=A0ABR1YCF8_9PEZI